MNTVKNTLFPTITNVIRKEHTQVLASFHQYETDGDPKTKRALVETVCLALEIHTQLEEEIFYPAMRSVTTTENTVLDKSVPEHEAIRQAIDRVRNMEPTEPTYDQAFLDLMKTVMHHLADEETALLPEAELRLKDTLGELGAQMIKRRLQLTAPHMGDIALRTIRARPASSMLLAAGALVAGTYVIKRRMGRHP